MKTPSTRHHRRSPRLVAAADAADDKALAANGMTIHTLQETTHSKHQQSSSSTRRCSPRLQDYNDNTTAAQEENWNQTNFHPYKPSPPQQEAYSSTGTTALLDNRKVAFHQGVQDQGQAAAPALSSTFVTPAYQGDNTTVSSAVSRSLMSTRSSRNSAVTPQGRQHHEASMALAALCHASDQRMGRMPPRSATHYLEQAVNSTCNSSNFPLQVHAMVNQVHESAPRVLSWTHDGQAFCVYKPKSRILVAALAKHFRHGNYGSLVRQLNMYGWSKVRNGEFKGSFYNKDFHRDPSKTNFHLIQRHSSLSSSTTRTTRPKRKTAIDETKEQNRLFAEIPSRGTAPKVVSVAVCFKGKVLHEFDNENLVGPSPGSPDLSFDFTPPSSIGSAQMFATPAEAFFPLQVSNIPKPVEKSSEDTSVAMDVSPQEVREQSESPMIAFDGIEFAAPNYALSTTQNLPSLVDEEPHPEVPPIVPFHFDSVLPITMTWGATDYMKMTLHGGNTLCVSPLDAFAADSPSEKYLDVAALEQLAVTSSLASPVELSISPSSRQPPPFALTETPKDFHREIASPDAKSVSSPLSLSADSGWLENFASPSLLSSLWD